MRSAFLLFFLMSCSVPAARAQHEKRAIKLYGQALNSYAHWEKADAYNKMEKAIRLAPTLPDLYSQLGEWYYEQHYFDKATQIFRQAAERCPDGHKRFAKPLTKCLIAIGAADSALNIIYQFATSKDIEYWTDLRQKAIFVRAGMLSRGHQQPVRLDGSINSRYPELFPCFDGLDTTQLYFNRRNKNTDQDFYCATKDTSGHWEVVDATLNSLATINTISNEESQFISADGHYLFFSRSDNRSENGWESGGYDLYMAYREATDSPWIVPLSFKATINSPACETMPCLSPDYRELYFVSDRPGGYGGKDIWISTFENYLWQKPRNAGPNVNSAGDETAPYVCMDSKTLFFSSDGRTGFGGKDIFQSKKVKDTIFTAATNLGYPINTACNEESTCLLNSTKLYFGSDRQGPSGNYDLYETYLPLTLKPEKTVFLSGYAFDSISREKLPSTYIFITNARSGDTVYQVLTNRGDGTYSIPLKTGVPYAFHSARISYTDKDDTMFLRTDTLAYGATYLACLLRSDYKKPIHDSLLAVIHFDVNRAELADTERQKMNLALQPFADDKDIVLYVNGYTDNTGTPLLNEELSAKRARQVMENIMNLGIDESLIISRGWGEANPISPNETEEGQRRNRRVEVILRRE